MSYTKWDFDPYERDRLFSENRSIIQSQEDSSPSDTLLIKRAQEGDKVAFDLLDMRYRNQIYRFHTRMVRSRSIGEDLTQETFLRAWKALSALRDPTKFLSWLYRIAMSQANEYYRRPGVLPGGSYEQSLKELEEVSISGPEEQVEAQERLKEALTRVSPKKCRACLILYHIEGYSISRIADFLGIKQSSARQYISSGLNQLKYFLEEDNTSREER